MTSKSNGDGSLTQEEIDLLLNMGSEPDEEAPASGSRKKKKKDEILSQSEIDALLASLSGGESVPEDHHDVRMGSRVASYDFSDTFPSTSEDIRALQKIQEEFALTLRADLKQRTGLPISVHLRSVDQMTMAEYMSILSNSAFVATLDSGPGQDPVLFDLGKSVFFALLDSLLGGVSEEQRPESSQTTSAEIAAFQPILRKLIQYWRDVLPPAAGLHARLVATEPNPSFLDAFHRHQNITLVEMDIKVGDTEGCASFCLSRDTIRDLTEPVKRRPVPDGKVAHELREGEGSGHTGNPLVRRHGNFQAGHGRVDRGRLEGIRRGDRLPLSPRGRPFFEVIPGVKRDGG